MESEILYPLHCETCDRLVRYDHFLMLPDHKQGFANPFIDNGDEN